MLAIVCCPSETPRRGAAGLSFTLRILRAYLDQMSLSFLSSSCSIRPVGHRNHELGDRFRSTIKLGI